MDQAGTCYEDTLKVLSFKTNHMLHIFSDICSYVPNIINTTYAIISIRKTANSGKSEKIFSCFVP